MSFEANTIFADSTASRVEGTYSISIFFFYKGYSLILWDLTTNWSGLLFVTLTVVLVWVGFSSSAYIDVDTPRGDFKLFMIIGCFGVHASSRSKSI